MNYYLEYIDKVKTDNGKINADKFISFIDNLPQSAFSHYSINALNHEILCIPFENEEIFKNPKLRQRWCDYFSSTSNGPNITYAFEMLNNSILKKAPHTADILRLYCDTPSFSSYGLGMAPFFSGYDKIYSIVDTAVYAGDDSLLRFITDYMCKNYHKCSSFGIDSITSHLDPLYLLTALYKRELFNEIDTLFNKAYGDRKDDINSNSYKHMWAFTDEIETLFKLYHYLFRENRNSMFIKLCFNNIQFRFGNNTDEVNKIVSLLTELNAKTTCFNDIQHIVTNDQYSEALKKAAWKLLDDNAVIYLQDLNYISSQNTIQFLNDISTIKNLTLNIDNIEPKENNFFGHCCNFSSLFTLKFTKALLKDRQLIHTHSLKDNYFIQNCLSRPKVFTLVFNALDISKNDIDDLIELCLEEKNISILNSLNNLYAKNNSI